MVEDRELKVRCLELAEKLLGHASRDVADVVRVANTLFASLPPGPDASKTKQAMERVLGRESRNAESTVKPKVDPPKAGQVSPKPLGREPGNR